MESLRQFWTWFYVFGIGSFCLMAMVIVPLGFRDLLRLFMELNKNRRGGEER